MRHRALGFVLFVACGGGSSATPPATAPSASASVAPPPAASSAAAVAPPAPSASVAAEPEAPTVRVLEPGAEPRQPLRYAFTRKHETVRFDMKSTLAMTIGTLHTPAVAIPTTRMDMEIQPTEVSADGTLTATYRVTRVDMLADGALPAPQRKKLADDLHGLVGLGGRVVVTSRGITRESTVDVPPTAPQMVTDTLESLQEAMRRAAPVLPEEPVGVGARWEEHADVRAKAMHLDQVTTYTLQGRKGDVLDEDVALVQSAPPQTMHLPGKAANAHVELLSENGTGAGHIHRSLGAVATTSLMHLQTATKMLTIAAGQKAPMDMDLTLEMQTKPLP